MCEGDFLRGGGGDGSGHDKVEMTGFRRGGGRNDYDNNPSE